MSKEKRRLITLRYPLDAEEYAFAEQAAESSGYLSVTDYLNALLGAAFNDDYGFFLSERDKVLAEDPGNREEDDDKKEDAPSHEISSLDAVRLLCIAIQKIHHFDKTGDGLLLPGETMGECILMDALEQLAGGETDTAREFMDLYDEWKKTGKAPWPYVDDPEER